MDFILLDLQNKVLQVLDQFSPSADKVSLECYQAVFSPASLYEFLGILFLHKIIKGNEFYLLNHSIFFLFLIGASGHEICYRCHIILKC